MTARHKLRFRYKALFDAIGILIAVATFVLAVATPESVREEHMNLYTLNIVAGVILSAAFLAETFGLAPAVIEILLGFGVGKVGVHPVESLETLSLIGSVFLLFVAGTEVDLNILRKNLKDSVGIGTASVVAPLLSTYALLVYLGYSEGALLASIGVSTTGVAIVYSILRKTGLYRHPRGQLILSAAMAADIVSVLLFSSMIIEPTPLLIIYAFVLLVVPYMLNRFIHLIPRVAHELEVRLILALLVGAALFSEALKLHAVLFAFVLGLAFSDEVAKRRDLKEKIEGIVLGFLAPIFFTTAGLTVADVSLTTSYIILATAIFLISYTAKVVTSYFGLRLIGIRDSKLPIMMGARMTVSTVIAYTGLSTGLLTGELAGAIILSAIAATLTSGLLTSRTTPEAVV